MAALYSSLTTYLPLVRELHKVAPDLAAALLPPDGAPSVAIRLIRYNPDNYFFTNPHVDKSAITFIADTDEPMSEAGLVFAPLRSSGPPRLSEFQPVRKNSGESLGFLGAAARQAHFDHFEPAPHAVRPLSTLAIRHVAIVFWLLPGVNLAEFDTAIEYVDDLGSARPAKDADVQGMR
jgi:hypothetical protein